ncbi:MAG: phosphatidylglycerol lysyltransferase domain-containing protein [Dehalococcoidia bacterium]
MPTTEHASSRRLRLVEAHGYNGLALLTLYDGWRYFEPSDIEGFIAFELHRGAAVACGDPVCAEADLAPLIRRFAEYCGGRGWRFAFVGASARVGKVASGLGLKAIKVGEEPFFDLTQHSLSGRAAKKARSAVNLARRTGIVVEEYTRPSPAIDSEIEAAAQDWLETRSALPMGFLLRSRPLARREQKRIFTATHEGRVVGAVTCSPAPARGLLYVEEVIRRHDAPYGTSELLIETAREAAQADGWRLFSLGTSPLQGATSQPYGRFRPVTLLFRAICLKVNFIYSFRSLNHFKKKFAPSFWEDSFFVYQGSMLLAAFAVVTAFSPQGIPSLILPKRLQWLRLVPAVVLWTVASAGVALTGFAFWEFPPLQEPVKVMLDAILLTRRGGLVFDAAGDHRVISSIVVLAIGAGLWTRRARA